MTEKIKKGKLPNKVRKELLAVRVPKKKYHDPRPDITDWLVSGDQKSVAVRFSIPACKVTRMLRGIQPPMPEVISALEEIARRNKQRHEEYIEKQKKQENAAQ